MTRLTTLAALVLFAIGAAPESIAQKGPEPVRQSPPVLLDGFSLGDETTWSPRKAVRSSAVIEKQPTLLLRENKQGAIDRTDLFQHPMVVLQQTKTGRTGGIHGAVYGRNRWWRGLGVLFAELVRNIPTDHQADKTVGIVLGALAGALTGVAQTC